MKEKITVAHLVTTLDRIEQWIQVLRKGLESLPQELEVDLDSEELDEGSKQPFTRAPC